ncbi:MAG: CBS domain-containing protein [Planctomycetes bacterium]|nr:CBS domain-containing protein [Planctomycetota bacterium]
MKVSQIMTTQVVTIGPDDTLDEAMRLFESRGFRHLPVVVRGALVSLISERDVFLATGWRTAAQRKAAGQRGPTLVREIMRERVVTLTPEHPVEAAASMMIGKRVGAIPILDGNRFVGLVTKRDLLAAFRRRNPQAEWGVDARCKVSEYMHRRVDTTSPERTVSEVAGVCRERELSLLPVTEADRVVGVVSDHDLRFGFEGEHPEPISGVMATELVTVEPEEALTRAADSMLAHNLSVLPVVSADHTLIGLLTDEDIIQHCTSRPRLGDE